MKKSKTRLFINKSISKNLLIYIKNKQHHFLKNVLKVRNNDWINIFDGVSGEWESKVTSVNRDNTVLQVVNKIHSIKKSHDFWLIISPIKQHRMNLAIQKATELGVSRIIPCMTDYSNVRSLNIKNLKDNAIEAAEQSLRLDIPNIEDSLKLDSLLSDWPEDRKLIYCYEKANIEENIIDKLFKLKNSTSKWAVIIGPEGGFSEKENNLICQNKNSILVSLGKRVLRSDTAITVSLFCIQQILYR